MDGTLFHPGERLVQERTGERAIALANARIVSPRIPAAARGFIGQQHWCAIGAEDAAGNVGASLLAGTPGFAQVSDDLANLRLALDDPHGQLLSTEPMASLRDGQAVGLLFIDLLTRRRLRVNGQVAHTGAGLLDVAVGQAFPACPRYIQKREPQAGGSDAVATATSSGAELSVEAAVWITAADTLFIASLGPEGEADVSHRGGRPGFVQLRGQTLRIPDYNGNSMFNTLGNLSVESRCGLVLPDFGGARQLQLTGRAQVRLGVDEDAELTGGTGRWIEFDVASWRITPLNQPLAWRFVEASPFNP